MKKYILAFLLIISSGVLDAQTWTRLDRPDTNVTQSNINSFRRRWNSIVGYAGIQIPGDSTFAAQTSGLNWGDSSVSVWRYPIAMDSGRFGFIFNGGGATSDTFPTSGNSYPMIGIMWNLTDSANASTGWFLGISNTQWSTTAKGIHLQIVTVTSSRYVLTSQRSWAYTAVVGDTIWAEQVRVGTSDSIMVWKNSTFLGGWLKSGHAPATGYMAMYGRKANTNMKLKEVLYGTLTTSAPPDTTPPTVTMTTPAATNTDTVVQGATYTIAGTLTDAGSGASRIDFRTKPTGASSYSVVGTDVTSPYSYGWSTVGIAVGNCDIKLYGYDVAGNYDSTTARTIYVKAAPADVTAPTLTLGKTIADSSYTSVFTLRLQDAANDSFAIYIDNVKVLGGRTSPTCIDTTVTYTTSTLTVGGHSVRGRGKDQAGNAANTLDQSFTVAFPTTVSHWYTQYIYVQSNDWGVGAHYINNNSTDSSRILITRGSYKNYPFWAGTHFTFFGLNTPANFQPHTAVDTIVSDGSFTWRVYDGGFSQCITDFHNNGKIVLFTIGSDQDFTICQAIQPANVITFVASLMVEYRRRPWDGIDVDFEHGLSGNWGIGAADTANYRRFSQLLRDSLNTVQARYGSNKAAIMTMACAWNMPFVVSIQQYWDQINWMEYANSGPYWARARHTDAPYGKNADGSTFNLGAGTASTAEMTSDQLDIINWIALGGNPAKFGVGTAPYFERLTGGKLASDLTQGISEPRQSWATGSNTDYLSGQGNTPTFTTYGLMPFVGAAAVNYRNYVDTAVNTLRTDTLAHAQYLKIFSNDGNPANEQFLTFASPYSFQWTAKLIKQYNIGGAINYTLETGWLSPTNFNGSTRTDRWAYYKAFMDELIQAPSIDTTNPTISSFTISPNTPTIAGIITLTASGTDNVSVASATFKVNGNLIGSPLTAAPFTITYNTQLLSNGTQSFTVEFRDPSGNLSTSSISVTVNNPAIDNVKPVTTWVTPTNGNTISGTVNLNVTATDNVGVMGVLFVRDSTVGVGNEVLASPYTVQLNTTTMSNGSHVLWAITRDGALNKDTARITVTVSNAVAAKQYYIGYNGAKQLILNEASVTQTTGSFNNNSLTDTVFISGALITDIYKPSPVWNQNLTTADYQLSYIPFDGGVIFIRPSGGSLNLVFSFSRERAR